MSLLVPVHVLLRRARPAALAGAGLAVAVALAVLAPAGTPAGTSGARAADDTGHGFAVHPVRTAATYRMTAGATTRTATSGGTFEIVGSVSTRPRTGARQARPVVLVEHRSTGWEPVARVRSSRTGSFEFTVQAGPAGAVRVFRVQAGSFRGLRSAVTKRVRIRIVAAPAAPTTPPVETMSPTVPPGVGQDPDAAEPLPVGYVALGDASDWSYLMPSGGRWNPCKVIRWAYNPAGEGYPALVDVRRAFARIAGVTGLQLTYVGATSWRYLGTSGEFPIAQADIAVGWANADEAPVLAGGVVGYGGGSARLAATGSDVRYRFDRGYLVLDSDHVLPGGFDRAGWGQIMQHEILHALGLGHATGPTQLMYGMASPANVRFGAGDIAGMGRIGAPAGCLA